jgi:hypothetical protein
MGAHTKGPWEFGPGYEPGDTTFDLFAPGGKQVIARASYENMWLSAYDAATDAANARLIASAPDLLEALRQTTAQISVWRSINGDMVGALADLENNARAAIRKATGEAS